MKKPGCNIHKKTNYNKNGIGSLTLNIMRPVVNIYCVAYLAIAITSLPGYKLYKSKRLLLLSN